MRLILSLFILILLSSVSTESKAQFMFAEGSPITMSDDSEKKVEELLVGDIVLTFNDKDKVYEDKKVKNIRKKMMNRFVRITLETGKQITLTADTPIYAEKGWASVDPEWTKNNEKYKSVRSCNPEDFVLFYNIESTDYIEIYSIRGILQMQMAYEIELEEGEIIVANGFLIGLN